MILLFIFIAPWFMTIIAPHFDAVPDDVGYWIWFLAACVLGMLAGCRDIDITVRK